MKVQTTHRELVLNENSFVVNSLNCYNNSTALTVTIVTHPHVLLSPRTQKEAQLSRVQVAGQNHYIKKWGPMGPYVLLSFCNKGECDKSCGKKNMQI